MSALLEQVEFTGEITGETPVPRMPQIPQAPQGDSLGEMLRDYMAVTERLQATHETLAREVVRLRDELEHKNRELERRERLAALGEMAAGVAHEVRNPLGAIQLYNGLLRKQIAGDDATVSLLDKIDAGIRAIDDVVQDTLALAPRNGAVLPLSVRMLIDVAAEFCRPAFELREVRLCASIADEALSVSGEERALQRVLINLISNAIDASPDGGVVGVTAAGDGAFVSISVSDRGSGIPEEMLDRIFDPFFTTKAKGTGLGLSIAHRLVEAHAGRLSAGNRSGGGAEFTVTLPAIAGRESRMQRVASNVECTNSKE